MFCYNLIVQYAEEGFEEFSHKECIEFYKEHYRGTYGDFRLLNVAARMGRPARSLDDFVYIHRGLWDVLRMAVNKGDQPCYTSFNKWTQRYHIGQSRTIGEARCFVNKHESHEYGVKCVTDKILEYVATCPHEHANRKLNELVDHMLHKVLNGDYWETLPTSFYKL